MRRGPVFNASIPTRVASWPRRANRWRPGRVSYRHVANAFPSQPQSYRRRPRNQVQSSFYPSSHGCELRKSSQHRGEAALPKSDQMCSSAAWRPPPTKDTKTPQTPFLTDHPSGSLLGPHVLRCISRIKIFCTMNHRTRADVKKAVDQRRRRDGYDTNHQGR